MAKTPHLNLPYISAAQAQKHVTHNEALRALDAIVHLSLLDRDLSTPPTSPNEGDRYLVASNAIGDWSGQEHSIAAFQDGAWDFYTPNTGWLAWIVDEAILVGWDGSNWVVSSGGSGSSGGASVNLNPATGGLVGVNATADSTNRLSVNSPATLFNHEGDDHQIKVNKNTNTDTASVLFQTGFSGRAEFGLTGDDDFHMKVSPDGNTFHEGLMIDKNQGSVSFPNGVIHPASGQSPEAFIGVPGVASIYRINSLHAANPRTFVISSIASDIITITTSNADHIFDETYLLDNVYVRVWNISKSTPESAWVRAQPSNNKIRILNAADLSGWTNGEIIQVGDPTSVTSNNVIAIDISPMMSNLYGQVFRQRGMFYKYYISGSTSALTSLQTTQIGLTPTGTSGSFNNSSSNNQGVPGQGTGYIPCSELSPISNSNLVFVKEKTDASGQSISISLISALGILVEM